MADNAAATTQSLPPAGTATATNTNTSAATTAPSAVASQPALGRVPPTSSKPLTGTPTDTYTASNEPTTGPLHSAWNAFVGLFSPSHSQPATPSTTTPAPPQQPKIDPLNTDQTLRYGAGMGRQAQSSGDVKHLQTALGRLNFNVGQKGDDGKLGNDTKAAIKAFQRAHGLTDDGIAGAQTLQAINDALADPVTPGTKADPGKTGPKPAPDTGATPKSGKTDPTPGGATPNADPPGTGDNGVSLKANHGRVSPGDLNAYLTQQIAKSKLNGFIPSDGKRHGIDGSPQSWAKFMTKLANFESGYKPGVVGDRGHFGTGSRGLFQLSQGDAKNYGLNGGRNFSEAQLADPETNANAAIAIMQHLVTRSNSIHGAGAYWSPIRNRLV